jgi:phosphoglycolate phosphatase
MNYKAVVFDLDGTLVDSAADLGNAVNRVLKAHGYPVHSISRYQDFIGNGAEIMVKRALPEKDRGEVILKECLNEFMNDYNENYNVDTVLYDGIPELLDHLSEKSIILTLLTNKPEDITFKLSKSLLSKWDFKVVMGSSKGIPKKPDPTGAKLLLEKIGIPGSQTVYFGDSGIDMKTAVLAGMVPVGVLWGFREKEELINDGAKYVFEKPLDILGKIQF